MKFVSEKQAVESLERKKFTIEKGRIRAPRGRDENNVTESESDAIDYLCQEWDYTY